jgi:hypothetical protein
MASTIKIRLPTGGTLIAAPDPFQAIPSDCSRIVSFLPLVTSYLASIQCLLKVLQLTRPLIEAVTALPSSPKLAAVIPDFLKAAHGLEPCLNAVTGAGVQVFVKDLFCLTIKALNCIIGEMKTLLSILSGLTHQLGAAKAAGNTELVELLQSEQNRASIAAGNLIASIEPVRALLELSGAISNTAGISSLQFPAAGSQSDPKSLTELIGSLQGVAGSLQTVVETLGGCED